MGRDKVERDRKIARQRRRATKRAIANDHGQMALRLPTIHDVTPPSHSRSPEPPRREPDKNLDIFIDSCTGKSKERETMQRIFCSFTKLSTPKGRRKRNGPLTNYFFPVYEFKTFVHRWEKAGYVLVYHSRDQHTPYLSVVYNHAGNKMKIYFPREDEDFFGVSI